MELRMDSKICFQHIIANIFFDPYQEMNVQPKWRMIENKKKHINEIWVCKTL